MNTEQYLAISSLAYKDLRGCLNWRIGELYSPSGPLDSEFMNKVENRQLKSVASWALMDYWSDPQFCGRRRKWFKLHKLALRLSLN